jgi:hypothetical protein
MLTTYKKKSQEEFKATSEKQASADKQENISLTERSKITIVVFNNKYM